MWTLKQQCACSLSGDDRVDLGPEITVEHLNPPGYSRWKEKRQGGCEGVGVGDEGSGREGGEVGEEEQGLGRAALELLKHYGERRGLHVHYNVVVGVV